MSTYLVKLLLEALTRVHSYGELIEGGQVTELLVRDFFLSPEEAEAIIEGALELKKARVESGDGYVPSEFYVQ